MTRSSAVGHERVLTAGGFQVVCGSTEPVKCEPSMALANLQRQTSREGTRYAGMGGLDRPGSAAEFR